MDNLNYSKKEIIALAAKAVALAVILAGHFFMVRQEVSQTRQDMAYLRASVEKFQLDYQEFMKEHHHSDVQSAEMRSKYIDKIEQHSTKIADLETRLRFIEENYREILTRLDIIRGKL